MSNNNGKKWDVNQLLTFIGVIIALLSLVVAVIAVAVTVTTPELRNFFGLKEGDTPVPSPTPAAPAQSVPVPQPKLKTIPQKIETPPVKQAAVSRPPVIYKEKEPAGPKKCTIGENKSQRIEEAETNLSIIFNKEYEIVTLTISPDGKQSSNRAVLNGYTEEFTSSAGVFLVNVLNVDWNSRTVTVQVSRKR
jgi:hypothetical protein